jgi:hypothetical protein
VHLGGERDRDKDREQFHFSLLAAGLRWSD